MTLSKRWRYCFRVDSSPGSSDRAQLAQAVAHLVATCDAICPVGRRSCEPARVFGLQFVNNRRTSLAALQSFAAAIVASFHASKSLQVRTAMFSAGGRRCRHRRKQRGNSNDRFSIVGLPFIAQAGAAGRTPYTRPRVSAPFHGVTAARWRRRRWVISSRQLVRAASPRPAACTCSGPTGRAVRGRFPNCRFDLSRMASRLLDHFNDSYRLLAHSNFKSE